MRYFAFTLLVVGGFAWAESRGLTVLGGGHHAPPAPASVRTSPGGYRSYHFWHSGFQGGK